MIPLPSDAQMEAAAKVMNDGGFDVRLPWEGDLDDVERERFNVLRDAIAAAMRVASEGK